MMSWILNHPTLIAAILLPAYGLFEGRRLAVRLWRDGWGPVSLETMLRAQGVGVIAFFIFVFYTPSITVPLA